MLRLWWVALIPALLALPSCARKGKATSPKGRAAASKVLYHCPMHPDYVSDKPGDCPICGMKLVPVKGAG